MTKIRTLFLIPIILAATGCGILGDNTRVILWSPTADILPFVDRYNAAQEKFKIEVRYLPVPADELLASETVPDLMLSEKLSSPLAAARMDVLNDLINRGGIDPHLLYRDLLSRNQSGNNTVALPFSFHLPLIVFRKGVVENAPDGSITVENLRAIADKQNVFYGNQARILGFSPLYNEDFIFYAAALFNVRFRCESGPELIWDDDALLSFMTFLTEWSDGNAGGLEQERDFIQKYLYEPPYKIIREKQSDVFRLGMFAALERDFFAIPAEKKNGLDFAWLSRSGKIAVADRVLFFGIPKGSRNRAGAIDFLKWVYSPEVQSKVLADNKKAKIHHFGLAGGFSALVRINEEVLPAVEPLLAGRIPAEDRLLFPDPLPTTWEKLKNESILPWIYSRLGHETNQTGLAQRLAE